MKDFLINQCIDSIYNANREISKIDDKILEIEGMSTPKVRHLMNNICNFQDCNFLEVGTYMGSTLCSAAYKNNGSFIGIDNFSEFNTSVDRTSLHDKNKIKNSLYSNIEKTKQTNISFHESDFFTSQVPINSKINVFFYDGIHRYQNQYGNLKILKKSLDKYFIYLVDDYFCKVSEPKKASVSAINDFGFEVVFYCELQPNEESKLNYHGGIGAFVLKNI